MIAVKSVEIEEFRGIRKLKLQLDGKNFAVCGPNGTGKSGIVDAVEFALTGSISRLTGKGRGSVSVKSHGPHVNCRNNPERAVVTLEAYIPNLGKTATISRTVKAPKAPTIVPDEPAVRAAFEHLEHHPEFTLSRREIIKYVLAEPGERAKEIQALLQLDDLETIRATLLKIKNSAEKEEKLLAPQRSGAAENLARALDVPDLKRATVLDAVNVRRATLGLAPLAEIKATTSIRDGLDSADTPAAVKVPKVQATSDIVEARAALSALKDDHHAANVQEARVALKRLKLNEFKLSGVTRDSMLATALDLFDEHTCPVCKTEWNPDEFRRLVEAQRQELVDLANERQAVEHLLQPILSVWRAAYEQIAPILSYASSFSAPIETSPAKAFRDDLSVRIDRVSNFLPLDDTIAGLGDGGEQLSAVESFVEANAEAIAALPEPSERDTARDYLTVGQERLEAYRNAAQRHEAAKSRAAVAIRVHAIYSDASDCALEAIYKEVEAEFREFYRLINGDDESRFEAQLTPSLGKLGFEVDFYGKGFFPPGAYHSEGHQDGMGLCLYLALMKHLLGDGFGLAVLDDVVMSVDTGHRREVCNLLKSRFPNTQFILTTHDEVWLKHMKSGKLIESKQSILFRKWHVDHGPAEWKTDDVWAEIGEHLSNNDVRAAAALLRYYLEYMSAEWCSRLAARVEFRSDGRFELGDLLPSAIGALRSLYKKAKAANQSWSGPAARMAEIDEKESALASAATAASVDQWQINPSVHYNEWANLKSEDFAPVVDAFKLLERQFECASCSDPLYIAYTGREKEALRCACSAVNFNLKEKPKQKAA